MRLIRLIRPIGLISPMSPMSPMRPMGLMRLIGPIRPISLIGLIILCLTLVSCGGGGDDLGAPMTEAPNDELVPITFSGSEGAEAAVTRADGSPLSEVATRFQVWGYKNMTSETQKVFPCYQVDWHANSAATTTTNTNNWEYIGTVAEQTIKFWDWSAQAYRFFAATGFDKEAAVPATPAGYDAYKSYGAYGPGETTYSVSMLANATNATEMAKSPYFSRLWYSTGNPTYYPDKQFGKPVTLEFVKPYTRVRFIYTYVYPREAIVLRDQKFRPSVDVEAAEGDKIKIVRKSIVTVTYPLSGVNTQESYSTVPDEDKSTRLEAFTEDYDPEVKSKEYTTCDGGWYTVAPNVSQGSYTLTVSINGDVKTAVVPAAYMQWKPGYSYTYVFKITDKGGIEVGWVEYAVVPWSEMAGDRDVYNW